MEELYVQLTWLVRDTCRTTGDRSPHYRDDAVSSRVYDMIHIHTHTTHTCLNCRKSLSFGRFFKHNIVEMMQPKDAINGQKNDKMNAWIEKRAWQIYISSTLSERAHRYRDDEEPSYTSGLIPSNSIVLTTVHRHRHHYRHCHCILHRGYPSSHSFENYILWSVVTHTMSNYEVV